MTKEVDFTATGSRPVIIEVDRDGTPYLIKVAVAVLSVSDTGNSNDQGIPIFTVQASLAVNTEKKK